MLYRISLIILATLCSYPTISLSSEPKSTIEIKSKNELQQLVAQANKGDTAALIKLGDHYYIGRKTNHNLTKAVHYYQKASQLGAPMADYRLGGLYSKGKGVEKNPKTAFEYYEKAANKGLVAAQMRMAFLYEKGAGVDRDPQKSLEWYRKAAAKGHPQAQYKLGLALSTGMGTTENLPQAVAWLERAAKQGSQLSNVYKTKLQEKVSPQALVEARLQVEHEIHAQLSQI
jgi:localization factor PodJL